MKIIQSFHISHCQFSSVTSILHEYSKFIIISELMLPLIKVHPLFRFPEFLPKVLFSCPGSYPGDHITFACPGLP